MIIEGTAERAGIMNEEELPKELRKVLGNSKRERAEHTLPMM